MSAISAYLGTTIEHHGVIGQKWGIKNGPPYPLSEKISNGEKLIRKRLDRGLKPSSPFSPESRTRAKVNDLRASMSTMTNQEIRDVLDRIKLEQEVETKFDVYVKADKKAREDAKANAWYNPTNIKKNVDTIVSTGKTIGSALDVVDGFMSESGQGGLYSSFGLPQGFKAKKVFD